MLKDKINCAAGILTFNSGKSLKRALESIKDFKEIIVSDGGSTDDTLDIARQYNCRIIKQNSVCKDESGKLIDFSCARNQLLNLREADWFLCIDADEYLTKELLDEIRRVTKDGAETRKVYWFKRKYVVQGKVIDYASTYPNKQIRLYHRDSVSKYVKKIHEKVVIKDGSSSDVLEGYMMVPFDESVKSIRKKWDHYISIELERMGDISFFRWLFIVYSNTKVSILFALRLLRNRLFYKGNHMPWAFEVERQLYNLKFSIRSFGKVKFF